MINRNRRRRSKLTFLLVLALPVLVLSVCVARRESASRDYKSVIINGHQAHVLIVDRRNGETIRPVLVPAPGMEFQRLMDVWKPRAAINGGYFDRDYKPIGDVVASGKVLARGYQRSAVAVTDSGRVRFRHRSGRAPFRWAGYSAGLACGPMLVCEGKSVVGSRRDGFSRSLRASRSAVGVSANGNLLMTVVEEGVTLEELAKMMIKIGARDAMNLDGGGSCALYGDGKTIVHPYARMSTVLLVTARH